MHFGFLLISVLIKSVVMLSAFTHFRRISTPRVGIIAARALGAATKDTSDSTPMPITVLSGFLGTGKTTFLEKVLKNKAGIKFGVLVNDVASVNIDPKLIQRSTMGDGDIDTLELQNGCVCCSLADDMLVSIRQFADMASKKGARYDHIIWSAPASQNPAESGTYSKRCLLCLILDCRRFHWTLWLL